MDNSSSRETSHTKQKRGWEGQEMELEHAQEIRKRVKSDESAVVAVDLEQFRNYQVGKGYQAKFVVRQRLAEGDKETQTFEFHRKTTDEEGIRSRKDVKDRKREPKKKSEVHRKAGIENVSAWKYLECEGFRNFLKGLAEIE